MAKNFILLIALCFTFCIRGTADQLVLRDQVAKTYSSQIGVREKSGKNDGPQVKLYLASVNLKEGYAWCGAFVNWSLNQNDLPGAQYGAMANAWFPKRRVIWSRSGKQNLVPQRADLFGLYYHHLKRIGHVGFIDKWDPGSGYAVTVEGNTNQAGSREGDGVYRKRRDIRQIYAVSNWIST